MTITTAVLSCAISLLYWQFRVAKEKELRGRAKSQAMEEEEALARRNAEIDETNALISAEHKKYAEFYLRPETERVAMVLRALEQLPLQPRRAPLDGSVSNRAAARRILDASASRYDGGPRLDPTCYTWYDVDGSLNRVIRMSDAECVVSVEPAWRYSNGWIVEYPSLEHALGDCAVIATMLRQRGLGVAAYDLAVARWQESTFCVVVSSSDPNIRAAFRTDILPDLHGVRDLWGCDAHRLSDLNAAGDVLVYQRL